MTELFYRYWGKSGRDETEIHLLAFHCLDVGTVATVLLQRDPLLLRRLSKLTGLPATSVRALAVLFAVFHDLGKFCESFQNILPDVYKLLTGRESRKPYHVRHDLLGVLAWENLALPLWLSENWFGLNQSNIYDYDLQDCLNAWFQASGGHHGRPPERPANATNVFDTEFNEQDKQALSEFCSRAALLAGAADIELDPDSILDLETDLARASWIMAGLITACDWLASNPTFFPPRSKPLPLADYWEYSLNLAERALDQSGLTPVPPSETIGVAGLFPHLNKPTALQRHVEEIAIEPGPELFILEESTGAGKTEAALILAHRCLAAGEAETIFIGLPTMATSNAMYARLAVCGPRLFAPGRVPSIILAHGSRRHHREFNRSIILGGSAPQAPYHSEEDSGAGQCAAWLADNNKKSLLGAVGVGTVDQAVMSILPVRHQSLRLLGLSRSVLIVDEVHAYDQYLGSLIEGLLEFQAMLGGKAILLSATLPGDMKRKLTQAFYRGLGSAAPDRIRESGYPLVTIIGPGRLDENVLERTGAGKEVTVETASELDPVVNRILRAADQGACVCWIRNTVDDALQAFNLLAPSIPEDKLLIFHARLALGDRLDREREILDLFGPQSTPGQRAGRVLVATQVVEQSLDVDFDLLVTDLCPMDLLIQRAGRLHRRIRPGRPLPKPVLIVYGPPPENDPKPDWYQSFFPGGAFVYPLHGRLFLTARLLDERRRLVFPDDSRMLIEEVFGAASEELIPVILQDRDRKTEGELQAQRGLAWINRLKTGAGYDADIALPWQEDTPTRLGTPVSLVRLAKWDGRELVPWRDDEDPRRAWSLSEIKVRKSMISNTPPDVPPAPVIEAVVKDLPDQGRYSLILPLARDESGLWTGQALDGKEKPARVLYSPRTGLFVEKTD